MPRKKQATAAATLTPKNVLGKWGAEGAPVETQIKRAASSLAWYRRALRGDGLKAGTRATYKAQVRRYEALLAELRAERDAAKAAAAES